MFAAKTKTRGSGRPTEGKVPFQQVMKRGQNRGIPVLPPSSLLLQVSSPLARETVEGNERRHEERRELQATVSTVWSHASFPK